MLISGRNGMRLIDRAWGRAGRPHDPPDRFDAGRIAVQYIHNYAGALNGVPGDGITFVCGHATDLRSSKLLKSSPAMSQKSRQLTTRRRWMIIDSDSHQIAELLDNRSVRTRWNNRAGC